MSQPTQDHEDVTAKAKTIALSAQFGPFYEQGMKSLLLSAEKELQSSGKSEVEISEAIKATQGMMAEIIAAKDPDYFATR